MAKTREQKQADRAARQAQSDAPDKHAQNHARRASFGKDPWKFRAYWQSLTEKQRAALLSYNNNPGAGEAFNALVKAGVDAQSLHELDTKWDSNVSLVMTVDESGLSEWFRQAGV